MENPIKYEVGPYRRDGEIVVRLEFETPIKFVEMTLEEARLMEVNLDTAISMAHREINKS